MALYYFKSVTNKANENILIIFDDMSPFIFY